MDITAKYGDFLSGEKLSVGARFQDLSSPAVVDRIEYLRQRCTGQKVLHLGCLDHAEVITQRMKDGTWLHGIISEVSAACLGIDINASCREIVRSQFDVDNIELIDLCNPFTDESLSKLTQTKWEVILCPEMLEHITNHQQFLLNLSKLASMSGAALVITVPNAFGFVNFINALRGFEAINTDHKYWFTFYTLSRLLTSTGWRPRELVYYNDRNKRRWVHVLSRLAIRVSRMFSSGLIVEATPH